ncbi:MAG: asparagine synthase (glutamine-hydrolyzing) [Terriglobia bacterium]
MCGIAGIVNNDSTEIVRAGAIHQMCQAIAHRGPDDEGIYAHRSAGLGMRRLSIIDVDGGHQPIHNEDETLWVVFNGEIYNFPELRPELERRGHRFYTNTDTEVIIHLYEDMGSACVQKLRGMFAFAVFDERRRRLLLARDRLGIKPLYYAALPRRLLFGSEIKAILAAAPDLQELNPAGLAEYFYFGYIPDPSTAFKDIRKLPPGHLLDWEDGRVKLHQYWDLPAYGTRPPQSEEDCLDEMEQRLAEAVRIRLISDVPLGAMLSGGVDSSIVVALMARASKAPVKTFSIGFTRQDFNEAHYARLVAQRFGTDHHELTVEPDIGQMLDGLTRSLEEPFGDSSMIPTYYISQLAREHVTVALSGDGGDELFAGYNRYAINLRPTPLEPLPEWARRLYRQHVHPLFPRSMRGRGHAYNIALPWDERYLDSLSLVPSFERQAPLLSDGFRTSLGNADPLDRFRDYLRHAPAVDRISKLLYLDTKTNLAGDILTKVDRMSMATSLEDRVPMLDHLFVEYAASLPAHWKLRGNEGKYILKKLAERLGVPREAIYRRKQGFALPLVHWIRNELKQELTTLLLEPRTLQRGYLNASGVRQMLDEHMRGRRDYAGSIWRLLVFELWHRNFLGRTPNEILPLNTQGVKPGSGVGQEALTVSP